MKRCAAEKTQGLEMNFVLSHRMITKKDASGHF